MVTGIIYSQNKEDVDTSDCTRVYYLNPNRWRGNTESCDVVFTDREDVGNAYRDLGVEVRPITDPKRKLENKFDQTQNFPEKPKLDHEDEKIDYESMPWPKLKSLASSMTDEKVTNKAKALEVLKNS